MRKNVTSIVAFILFLSTIISLVSCSTGDGCSHQWGEWQLIKEATCSEGGYSIRICSLCGTEDRTATYPTSHKFSSEWVFDGTYHWHNALCGHEEKSDRGTHVYDGNLCTVCGALRATQGLEYRGNLGEDTYRVVSPGTTLDVDIVIAKFYLGYLIVGIDTEAFKDTVGLNSVVIQEYVLTVGDRAFSGCTTLRRVSMSYGTEKIGEGCFENCTSLEQITFYGTVEQWEDIEKGEGWDRGTGNYTVVCRNGIITK